MGVLSRVQSLLELLLLLLLGEKTTGATPTVAEDKRVERGLCADLKFWN